MKISVNRLCQLAGIENSSSRSGRLNEGSNRSFHEDPYYQDEVAYRYGQNQLSEEKDKDLGEDNSDFFGEAEDDGKKESRYDEADLPEAGCTDEGDKMKDPLGLMDEEMTDKKLDEVIEVDERVLVQELRRAKRLMNESRIAARRQSAERTRINSIVEEEVANLMRNYDQSASWVYGENKPRRSRQGRITTTFPGIGFGGKKF